MPLEGDIEGQHRFELKTSEQGKNTKQLSPCWTDGEVKAQHILSLGQRTKERVSCILRAKAYEGTYA